MMLPWCAAEKILEVGGGDAPIFHPNMDIRRGPAVDIVADLSGRWPAEDASFDGIYSAYCLEHISWRKLPDFVAELHRVVKSGGRVHVVTANTEAQMKWALAQPEVGPLVGQCLFGDNNYPENTHRAALSPAYAIRLFRECGFADVAVLPWGALSTDMIIEARKAEVRVYGNPNDWTTEDREIAYGEPYFNGGGPWGGYAQEGYRDFPVHDITFRRVMALKPESVLELGCARGYILQRLHNSGVMVHGLEVSEYATRTSVCGDHVVEHCDITKGPWRIATKEFDLCLSVAVLEHIPEKHIDTVIAEIKRTTKRGLHGIDFGDRDDGFDKTHCLFRPKAWWEARFGDPSQRIVDKEELERA